MSDTKNKPWRNWCFTLIEPSEDQIINLQLINDSICKYIIFGHELTKLNTPHLQGYIELYKVQRLPGIKKILDPILGSKSKIHVEPANAGRDYNKIYCSKGLQSHEEYLQFGENGPNYGLNANIYEKIFKEKNEGKGKRNDWIEIYESILINPDYNKILQEYPEYAIKYPFGIQKAIDNIIYENNKTNLHNEMNNLKLYTWETNLLNELKNTPDKRKIIWYIDHIGGCGKTTFAKFLLSKGNCAYFTNAKSADIAHAYNGENTVIFDFTRSIEGHVNYSIIESIKNGIVFCSKYNSNTKINCTPHIICFSNFEPELNKLSNDRWDIRSLNKDLCTLSPVILETSFQAGDIKTPIENLLPYDFEININLDLNNIDIKSLEKLLNVETHPTDVEMTLEDTESVQRMGHFRVDDPFIEHSECVLEASPRPQLHTVLYKNKNNNTANEKCIITRCTKKRMNKWAYCKDCFYKYTY